MTEARGGRLIEGTLADLRTLMGRPVGIRPGNTALVQPANPAAAANLLYTVSSTYWERVVSLLFTLTTSATAGGRTAAINYLSPDGVLFNQTPATPLIGPSSSFLVSADLTGTPSQAASAGLSNTGTQTSPVAGTAIASIAVAAGVYQANWNVSVRATLAAADADNFGLNVGATQVAQSENGINTGTSYAQNPQVLVVPAGGATITITAIANATTGAIYQAALELQYLSAGASYPQLPDLILKSGYQVQVAISGAQTGDQISGVQLLTEQYASNLADGSLLEDLEDRADRQGW